MSAKRMDSVVRREQIAEAALVLIAERGPVGFNIAGLARRVGLAPSAIYRHFSGKDAVIQAALNLVRGKLEENVAHAADAPDAFESLRLLFTRHVEMALANRSLPRAMFAMIFTARGAQRKAVRRVIGSYFDHIAAFVRRGRRQGVIRSDVDPREAASMFIGLVQSSVTLWQVSDGGLDLNRHARRVWKLYAAAVGAAGVGK